MSTGRYDLATGLTGVLTLWVGAFAQVSTIVFFAGMADLTAQPVGTAVAAFFISMLTYFLIDIAWVVGLEMHILNYFYKMYDFQELALTRPVLIAVFFLFSATANTVTVILPALDMPTPTPDYWTAALRAFVLGWFSYGNLALVQAWSYPRFPLEIVGIMPLSGGFLSCFSSLITVFICVNLL